MTKAKPFEENLYTDSQTMLPVRVAIFIIRLFAWRIEMRHPLVMGNWKLNGSRHVVNELVANLRKELAGVTGCAVAIAPPDMYGSG